MNYAVSEFKTILPPEARRLQECQEARGRLLRVFEAEGQCLAVFSWGAVSLPAGLRERLEPLIGREIAILRLEGYLVREVGGLA